VDVVIATAPTSFCLPRVQRQDSDAAERGQRIFCLPRPARQSYSVTDVSRLVSMADSDQDSSPAIRTHDQRLRVFVSSTLGELEPERRAARAAIEHLRLHPVMFETGARPHPAQSVYHAYIDQSDVFVGIYWQSYGWVGPGLDVSGLEDEYRLAAHLPRLLYVKAPAPDIEGGLSHMLQEIQEQGHLTFKQFGDAGELRELLLNDLSIALAERFDDRDKDSGHWSVVPVPVTGMVGREQDLAEVSRLVTTEDRRLVVLTGAGGVGKTRLALAVMEKTRSHWEDGVAFADLSSVSDASSVPAVIAAALDFTPQGRETSLGTLKRRLEGKHMLILIDDFDQVLEAAPMLPELLQLASRLHLLIASRVALRIRGERQYHVEPLALPGDGDDPRAAPAVRLLTDRIRDVRPGFQLAGDNTGAIVELCRRLDGLPLALELAASWMRLLTPQELLQRLEEYMERPGGLADLPDRQQTMAATVEWSYRLLPQAAQQMLTHLTVFAAPFTVDAVEAVCGEDASSATETLTVLLDHNMVRPAARPDGEHALGMLHMIRHFISQRLDNPDATLGRLEDYLLRILQWAAARNGSEVRARRLLDSEFLNLWVVLRWAARRQRPSGELLRRLGDVWTWLLIRGLLRGDSGLTKWIESWPAEGLPAERDMMARHWLTTLGLVERGQFAEVGRMLDEILPDARRLEDPSRWGLMLLLRAGSRPYIADSPARAEYEEALAVARAADDPFFLGYALSHFGLYLCVAGDPSGARSLHEEMIRITRGLGDDNLRAEAHYDLALDALSGRDPEAAHPHLAAAARLYADIDHHGGLARCLGGLAAMAVHRHDAYLAARLMGAADATRAIGLTPWPSVAEAEDRITEQVKAALSREEFATATDAGRAETAEAALDGAWAALEDRTNA